jgi:hypothetical protein
LLPDAASSGERLTMNRTNTIRTATTRMPLNFGCFCFKKSTPIRCSHRAFWFYGSVGIYFRLEYAYIGQVTVFFIVVKAIADHKFIRDLKAAVIRLDVRHAAAGLAEDGTDPDAVGIADRRGYS